MRAMLAGLAVAALAAAVVPSAPARTRTITMSGSPPAGALTADLAYFYRHSVRRPPRFSIVGGNTGTGIADATRGVVDVGLAARAWDPYPFILLNLFLSMLAAVQAPMIMMSQNRQDAKDRLRSELDFAVNRKAEAEIIQLAAKLNRLQDGLDDVQDALTRSR